MKEMGNKERCIGLLCFVIYLTLWQFELGKFVTNSEGKKKKNNNPDVVWLKNSENIIDREFDEKVHFKENRNYKEFQNSKRERTKIKHLIWSLSRMVVNSGL